MIKKHIALCLQMGLMITMNAMEPEIPGSIGQVLPTNKQCESQERSKDTDQELSAIEVLAMDNFASLPEELIQHIFFFISKPESITEFFGTIAKVALVDSQCKRIIFEKKFIQNMLELYFKTHPENTRQKEFAHAIAKGNVPLVKLLLDLDQIVNINVSNLHNQSTALMLACYYGHAEIVELLLDKEADVNAVNQFGCNALMAASHTNHREIIALLLDRGANIDAVTPMGLTALRIAIIAGHLEVIELLLDRQATIEAGTFAEHKGIQKLLQHRGQEKGISSYQADDGGDRVADEVTALFLQQMFKLDDLK